MNEEEILINIEFEIDLFKVIMKHSEDGINSGSLVYSLLNHSSGISLINFENKEVSYLSLQEMLKIAFEHAARAYKK